MYRNVILKSLIVLIGFLFVASCFKQDAYNPPILTGHIAGRIVLPTTQGQSDGNSLVALQRSHVSIASERHKKLQHDSSSSSLRYLFIVRPLVKTHDLAETLRNQWYSWQDSFSEIQRYDMQNVVCRGGFFCSANIVDKTGGSMDTARQKQLAQWIRRARESDQHNTGNQSIIAASAEEMKHGMAMPNDPYVTQQWYLKSLAMDAAWEYRADAADIIVAVIDSGANLSHPDLQNAWTRDAANAVYGADVITDTALSNDQDGRDTDPTDPGDNLEGNGRHSFHGTHTAGIIAATHHNSLGIAGMAPGVKVLPIRVLGQQLSGHDEDILDAVLWATGASDVPGLPVNTKLADVINMSLGGQASEENQELYTLFFEFLSQRTEIKQPIIVVAGGNNNQNAATLMPAGVARLITVGASRADGRRASYSNYGEVVDVLAPGGQLSLDQDADGAPDGILSTYADTYSMKEGTSMAAPVVSGLVALLKKQDPSLTPTMIQDILKRTADAHYRCDVGCGAGLIVPVKALQEIGATTPSPTSMVFVQEQHLLFSPGVEYREIHMLNGGNAAAQINVSIVGHAAELYNAESATISIGPQESTVLGITLDRQGFTAGTANVILTNEEGNELNIGLSFDDSEVPSPRALDKIAVRAYLRDDNGLLRQVGEEVIALREMGFNFILRDLPEAGYYVYAVGDDNLDGVFDAERESFGAYPIAADPRPVVVTAAASVTEIEFSLTPQFYDRSRRRSWRSMQPDPCRGRLHFCQ